MNKKFLSAILFGALMATSAGTFVSCKDYDDDIKNLQTQIDTNKTAIAELQKLVGAGNWVTSVAASGENLVVTMSNGTTATIAGIKGADGQDGKNAAEWTISEDGFWCKDGEKTTNVAIAQNGKDGKDGISAPSPFIGADGNWVVYTWDATKGEFVQEATEISAQGTSAYAVKADGIYTLYIADENGEMQEIALPATCDSFVATAPAALVEVSHQQATWTKVTGTDNKKLFAKLAAAFPEIETYEKDQLMKQGGNLPVVISPANLELTDEFKFSLQSLEGKVSEAVVSSPAKGMLGAEWSTYNSYIKTRSANSSDCLWTLNIEPAKNKKGTGYLDIEKPHTLVVENEKGTVVKTAFAYLLDTEVVGSVSVKSFGQTGDSKPEISGLMNEDEIDLLAAVHDLDADGVKDDAVFTITNGMNGKYIIEVDELDAEKYDVTVDDSKLSVGNVPAGANGVEIKVNLIALGLNGSVTQSGTTTLNIGHQIAAEGTLEHDPIVLNADKTKNKVRWNIKDLNFSAVQLDNFLKATKKLYVTYVDDNDKIIDKENGIIISAYKANGADTDVDYTNAVTFGFNLDATKYEPREYDVRLEAGLDGSTIYVAEGKLVVENPTTAAIRLADAFVDAEGVLQVTGNVVPVDANGEIKLDTDGNIAYTNYVTYALSDAFVCKNATITSFEDMDADDEENWIDTDKKTLKVDKYSYIDAEKQDLYKVRNFKVNYYLFGNKANKCEMEFQAQVVSEIYAEDPSTVISLTEARLTTAFGAVNKPVTSGEDKINESLIDFTQITKMVYAAGLDAGKEYTWWNVAAKDESSKNVDVTDYDKPKLDASKKYVVTSAGIPVEITKTDLGKFGMTASDYMSLGEDVVIYITIEDNQYTTNSKLVGWNTIMTAVNRYYSYKNASWTRNDVTISTDDQFMVDLFLAYYSKIGFNTKKVTKTTAAADAVWAANGKVKSVVFGFVNGKEDAEKYVATTINNDGTMDGTSLTAKSTAPVDVVGGQVIVPMYVKVTDAWGMVMTHEFNVTIKTVQE